MSELGHEARALFLAGRTALQPTAADRARVFAELSARLDLTIDLPPPDAVVAEAGTRWLALSALVIGLAIAAVFTPGALLGRHVALPGLLSARMTAPVVPATVSPGPSPAVESRVASPEPPAEHAPTAALASAHRARAASSDLLGEEVAILARAETELHAGRFASALELLDEHARAFPHGVLTQERSVARIQALCGLGRFAEGRTELKRLAPGSFEAASALEACSER
jgi:hypothetical protein